MRLAEVAGIPAGSAFDEVAVAQGLASVLRAGHGWSTRDLRDREGTEATGVRSGSVELPAMRRQVPVIEVVDLVHRYPGAPGAAVDGVSLRIVPGQTVAIVGQNGSGKSTLVKHLNGLMRPVSGAVRLDGQDIAGMPVHELARDVGFVFQDPDDQLFERSVEREVAFGPRHLGIPGSEVGERVARALALVGLDQERGTNPYDLGPSLRKLVALASVLASAPGVLVLDEPTGGQDAPGIARIARVVRDLSWAGRTVVAITHDMEFAAQGGPPGRGPARRPGHRRRTADKRAGGKLRGAAGDDWADASGRGPHRGSARTGWRTGFRRAAAPPGLDVGDPHPSRS